MRVRVGNMLSGLKEFGNCIRRCIVFYPMNVQQNPKRRRIIYLCQRTSDDMTVSR